MFVAGQQRYTLESAESAVIEYAERFDATVRYYDLGGPDEIDIDDRVLLADLGRMDLINARLDGNDAARLMQFDLAPRLAPLSVDLRLVNVDLDPRGDDPTYEAMAKVWRALHDLHGISDAKASKLLHLKRPALFPIIDSYVREIYRAAAVEAGDRVGSQVPHYWLALAADVRANAATFMDLRQALARNERHRRLRHLTDVRFQDILGWRLFGST